MRARLVVVLSVVASVFAAPAASVSTPVIEVLSNRADLVSGGDALVEIVLPDGASPQAVTVDVDGRDVTDAFDVRADGRFYGLVTGLAEGVNLLTARLEGGAAAEIQITNHPNGGPVFAGPQIQPWFCAPGALDAQCSRPVTYEFFYRNVLTQSFQPYDASVPPALIATTTTDHGVTVPYIVRVETGTQDRDQYKIGVLFDPSQPWTTGAPQPAWNGKLLVTHGGGCGTTHAEGTAPDMMNDAGLSRGFVVMSTALDNAGHSCNIAVQAESLMMAKERVIEAYGPLRYTIGTGCSGGSLTQNTVANAYPGIYDGIMPECTYPDAWSSALDVDDCVLLSRYWDNPTAWSVPWTEQQMAAAGGHFSNSVCHSWTKVFPFYQTLRPYRPATTEVLDLQGCNVPQEDSYDPQTREGIRCGLSDYMIAVLGARPDGIANRPLDNAGVQYGMRALLARQISAEQFVDLNAKIGSHDIDYLWQPGRVEAELPGLVNAYRSGAIDEANNLDKLPIIDRPLENVEIHESYRSWALRARLDAANGHHDNHVIWCCAGSQNPDALTLMDRWVAAIKADTSDRPLEEKVVAHRPAEAVDRCNVGLSGIPDETTCYSLIGPYAGTRWGAGGPFAGDVTKCQLKPLARSDYFPIQLTGAQWARLQQAFPSGACEYAQPGVAQQPTIPWLTYEDGPGGRELGEPPVSRPA